VKIDRVWACLRLQIVDAAEEIVGMAGCGVCRTWTHHAVMRNGALATWEHVARGGFDAGDQLSKFGHLMLFVPGLPGGAVPPPARIKVSTYASRSRFSDSWHAGSRRLCHTKVGNRRTTSGVGGSARAEFDRRRVVPPFNSGASRLPPQARPRRSGRTPWNTARDPG
jgi:hypothetical protein